MSTRVPPALPGVPQILDLSKGRPRRTREGLAEIVFVRAEQLEGALAGLDRVAELPRTPGRPQIQFLPYGGGYLGVPHCPPSGGGRTCWVMKGGPDDNPLAFVCVCRVESGADLPIQRPSCFLDVTSSPFRVRCVRGTCRKACRLTVATKGRSPLTTFQVGCACV
jgi:hypothetical protein